MRVPAAIGDVADRISILRLKRDRITDPRAHGHVVAELAAVQRAWDDAGLPDVDALPEWGDLADVNAALWDVEDELRQREVDQRFDDGFVQAARRVYRLNDRRAALKRAISARLGSDLVEQKAHPTGYRGDGTS